MPFIGYPKPSLKWSRNEETIEKGGHYDIIAAERHAVLIIRDVNTDDNGPYQLVAENELGMDSAIITIKISGKLMKKELKKVVINTHQRKKDLKILLEKYVFFLYYTNNFS